MDEDKQQPLLMSELAAAQMIEQVKRAGLRHLRVQVQDESFEWVVTVTRTESEHTLPELQNGRAGS